MRNSFKVVSRFAGSQVYIVRGGRHLKIDLQNATDDQLKMLHDMGHPAIQVKSPPKKKTSAKGKKTEGGGE